MKNCGGCKCYYLIPSGVFFVCQLGALQLLDDNRLAYFWHQLYLNTVQKLLDLLTNSVVSPA